VGESITFATYPQCGSAHLIVAEIIWKNTKSFGKKEILEFIFHLYISYMKYAKN
jgi:hypothetical protein